MLYSESYSTTSSKNGGAASINLFNFTPLPPVVQRHLHQVYVHLFYTILCATFGAYLQLKTNYFNRPFIPILITIGFSVYFRRLASHPHNFQKRRMVLGCIAFFNGWILGPLVSLGIDVGGKQLVIAGLGASAGIFGGLSISSMFARRRSWLYLGGTLFGFLNAMLWMSLFLRYEWVFNIMVYGGLFLFAGFVLYDSQVIIEKACDGDRDVLAHTLLLFVDLVAIFRRVLIIMIKNKLSRNQRRRRCKSDDE